MNVGANAIEWHEYRENDTAEYDPQFTHLRYSPEGWTEVWSSKRGWEVWEAGTWQPLIVTQLARRSPFMTLKTKSGRRMLVRASAVEFAIENALDNNLRPSVHIVLAGGDQGDAAVSWDEFVGALSNAEDSHPGQERGNA